LLKNPLILDITSSFENPADENMDMMPFETIHVSDDVKDKLLFVYPADDNFFEFYNIKVLSGQGFPEYYGNDSLPESYILNKKACDFLGWKPEDAIDKPFTLIFNSGDQKIFNGGRIVGVVEDFQMSSMKNEIKPYVFFQKSFWMESVQVKFQAGQTGPSFEAVRAGFEKSFPGFPMQYDYIEDLYNRIYKNEKQLTSLSLLLGFLAILLSALGLWGITGIVYQSRTKEIGIRKVNGATRGEIIFWLLKDINRIVLFSIIAGIPVAFILMRDWLLNYPLRISLQWWMFLLPALFIYLIAFFTVSWQANKAAGMNPVESLRYE
jgi:putative ABC transport system permease protein